MSWAAVAEIAITSMDAGQVGISVLALIAASYYLVKMALKVVMVSYASRQLRLGLQNSSRRDAEKLIDKFMEELE